MINMALSVRKPTAICTHLIGAVLVSGFLIGAEQETSAEETAKTASEVKKNDEAAKPQPPADPSIQERARGDYVYEEKDITALTQIAQRHASSAIDTAHLDHVLADLLIAREALRETLQANCARFVLFVETNSTDDKHKQNKSSTR